MLFNGQMVRPGKKTVQAKVCNQDSGHSFSQYAPAYAGE